MATRMLMMATTVMNSIRVKPRPPAGTGLPVAVARAIEGLALAERIHVPHVLPAPAGAVGLVLVAALAPLRLARHGVDGQAAQELHLEVDAAHGVHALHQRVQVGRVAL